MCYLAHAPAVARVLAGLVEIMGRAIRAAEALRGLQRRLSMRSAHRETQIAQEAVREPGVRRHALVVDAADLRRALCEDRGATPDDYRETVAMLEDTAPTARRVLGGAHPTTSNVEKTLREARDALAAREGDGVSSVCEAVEALTTGDA